MYSGPYPKRAGRERDVGCKGCASSVHMNVIGYWVYSSTFRVVCHEQKY